MVKSVLVFLVLSIAILFGIMIFRYDVKDEPIVIVKKSPIVSDTYSQKTDYGPYVEEKKSTLTGGGSELLDEPISNNGDRGIIVTESDDIVIYHNTFYSTSDEATITMNVDDDGGVYWKDGDGLVIHNNVIFGTNVDNESDGYIDEMWITDRILTQDEIKGVYLGK